MNAHPRAHVSYPRATFILILVTFFWGASFSLTYTWLQNTEIGSLLPALTLIALRMLLALGFLTLWQPRVIFAASRREFRAGLFLGALFFIGFALQTWGLAHTTPALSAFYTSVCSAWVPLITYVAFRETPRLLTLAGLVLALTGCACLVDGWELRLGVVLTLACSFFLAVEMVALDRLGKSMNPGMFSGGFFLSIGTLAALCAFLMACRGPGIGTWGWWTVAMLSNPTMLLSILGLALLPTAVAFHWMNTYQPSVPASHAALIYLLEPVFSSLFSVLLGHEHLTSSLLLGGALILLGNLLVEMPGWLSPSAAR